MTTPAQQDPMVQNLLQQNRDTLDRREPGQQEDQQQPASSTRDRERDDARGSSDDVAPVPAAAPVDHSDSPYGAAAWRERIQSPEYQQFQRELHRRERGMGPDAAGWRYTEDVTGEGYGEGVYRVTDEGRQLLPHAQWRRGLLETAELGATHTPQPGDAGLSVDAFSQPEDREPGFRATTFFQPEDREPTPELQIQPDLGVAARTRFAEVAPNLGDLLPDDPTGDYSTDTGGRRRSTSSEVAPNLVDPSAGGPMTFSTRGDPHEPGYQPGPTTSQALTVADRGDIQDLGTAHHPITPITVEDRPPHAFPVEALQDQADYLEPPLWLWSPDQAYMHGGAQRWEVAPNSGLVVPVAQAVPTPGYTRGPIEGVDIPLEARNPTVRGLGIPGQIGSGGQRGLDKAREGAIWVWDKTSGPISGQPAMPYTVPQNQPMPIIPGQEAHVYSPAAGLVQYRDDPQEPPETRFPQYLAPHDPQLVSETSYLGFVPAVGTGLYAAKASEDGYDTMELVHLGISAAGDVAIVGLPAGRFAAGRLGPSRYGRVDAVVEPGAKAARMDAVELQRVQVQQELGRKFGAHQGADQPASLYVARSPRDVDALGFQRHQPEGAPWSVPEEGYRPIWKPDITGGGGTAVLTRPQTTVPRAFEQALGEAQAGLNIQAFRRGSRSAELLRLESHTPAPGTAYMTTPSGRLYVVNTVPEPGAQPAGTAASAGAAQVPAGLVQYRDDPQDLGLPVPSTTETPVTESTTMTEPTPQLQTQPDPGVPARTEFARESTPTTPTTPTTPPNTPRIDLSSRRPKPPSPRSRIRLPRPGPDPRRSREAPRTRGNQPHIVEWVSHSLNRLDLRTGEHASRPASNTNVNTFRITRKGAESTDGKQYRAANLEIESSRGRAHATPVPGRKRRRSRRSRRDEADQAFPGTLTFVPRENNRRR